MIRVFVLAVIFSFAGSLSACVSMETIASDRLDSDRRSYASNAVSATLSGTAFITKDLDASIDFYVDFLAFKISRRTVLDKPAGLDVFGVSGDVPVNYVALVPADFSDENKNSPRIKFC